MIKNWKNVTDMNRTKIVLFVSVLSTVNIYPSVSLPSPFYNVHICSILPQIESHGSILFSKTPIRPNPMLIFNPFLPGQGKTKHAEVQNLSHNNWTTVYFDTLPENFLTWITLAYMIALFKQKIDWPFEEEEKGQLSMKNKNNFLIPSQYYR